MARSAGQWRLRAFAEADRTAVIALWRACGLTTPWNEPDSDIALCQATESAALLLAEVGDAIVGSVIFVITLPFSAMGDNVTQAREKLVDAPAAFTFTRCLGCFGGDN